METITKTNTQLVQECYGYFGEGNIPALLDALTDDIKWIAPGPSEVLWAGEYEGKEAVGNFFKVLDENAEFLEFEPHDFFENGNKVVCLGHAQMRSKETGKTITESWAMAFTFRGNKISEFREYTNTYAAYEAFRS